MATFGEHLVENVLPAEYHGRGPFTKAKLHEVLVEIAKKHPEKYPRIVSELKRIGDEIATVDGLSVGLDDIAPHYATRDSLISSISTGFHRRNPAEKDKALLAAQNAMVDHAKSHQGTMGEMVRSGGRGNAAQLMKIVGAPVLARDDKDRIIRWPILRGYSEGLKPSEAWATNTEARVNEIKARLSVTEPGDLGKILINNMNDKLVTIPDCGTKNGISMNACDSHIVDRYLAHASTDPMLAAGTLLTPQVAQKLNCSKNVVVRSPMTCEAPHGVCQKCQGLSPSGQLHGIGTNVGVRAAQALAEPLTQVALSSRHASSVRTGTGDDKAPVGIKGVRQLLEIPESFMNKATVAEHEGKVTRIENAPQGGKYVWVNGTQHYVPPSLRVTTRIGAQVEAGDSLSDGVPRPNDIVKHKGLGVGRQYLVDTLHATYKRAGTDVDKRHLETLASTVMNHVYVADPGNGDHGFMRGDVINYNRYKASLANSRNSVPLKDSIGETLADNLLHFTAGTLITPSVRDALTKQGIKEVHVATSGPHVEPWMRPASRTPLLNPDFLGRLSHRYLKESLLEGAHRGDTSDTQGYSPGAAYAAGTTFGHGRDGRY